MDAINREAMEATIEQYKAQIKTLEDLSGHIEHEIQLINDKVFDLQYELKGKGR